MSVSGLIITSLALMPIVLSAMGLIVWGLVVEAKESHRPRPTAGPEGSHHEATMLERGRRNRGVPVR